MSLYGLFGFGLRVKFSSVLSNVGSGMVLGHLDGVVHIGSILPYLGIFTSGRLGTF